MADDTSPQRFVAAPNPVEVVNDIQHVRSGTFIAASAGAAAPRGMLLRHIMVQGDKGVVMSATVSVMDVAFLVKSFAQMLVEDMRTLAQMPTFNLLTVQQDRETSVGNLRAAAAQLTEAAEKMELLPIEGPRDLKESE